MKPLNTLRLIFRNHYDVQQHIRRLFEAGMELNDDWINYFDPLKP